MKTLKERKNWTDTSGAPISLQNIGPINRASVLASLISKVKIKMEARYSSVLKMPRVTNILEAGLSVTVRDICQDGKFDLEKYVDL